MFLRKELNLHCAAPAVELISALSLLSLQEARGSAHSLGASACRKDDARNSAYTVTFIDESIAI